MNPINPTFNPVPIVVVCAFHDQAVPVVKLPDGKWVIASAARGMRISHGICETCADVMRSQLNHAAKVRVR